MAKTTLKTRIQNRHDTEANWTTASNATNPFIPLEGEVIVYDPDTTHTTPRLKIGDGSTKVGSLAFVGSDTSKFVTTGTRQTIDGDKTFTSDVVIGKPRELTFITIGQDSLGFTTGTGTSTLKSGGPNYEWALPAKTGTIALTSDIPAIPTNYVTTDTTQTISGAKTFSKAVSVSTDSTAGFEITGGGNTWKFNARTDDGPLNIAGTYTYQFPTKTGTIALTSDIPTVPTNYVTTNTSQTISGVKQFSGTNEVYTNYNTTTIGDIITCSTGDGGDYKTTTLAPEYLEFRYTDVGSTSTNPRVQLKVGAFPTTESTTPQVINLPYKSGTVVLAEDVPDLHRTDDSFTTSVWQTSTAAVDTQFGKYYYDCAIGEGKHYTIRVTSPYGLTVTTGLGFYPEVKCNNRCVEGSSNNFVRIYSNVKIAGTYDCIYW